MSSPIIDHEDLVPDQFRSSFRPLVNEIEDLVKVSICKLLSGGFSESVPLLVYADYENARTYQVVKIGEKGIIEAEARNWRKFIKNGPYDFCNVIHLKEQHTNVNHGLIVYSFVGQPGKDPITFKELYEGILNPADALRCLFKDVLKPLSDIIRRPRILPEISELLKISQDNRDQITQKVKGLSGSNDIYTTPKVTINGQQLYNPLHFYPFNASLSPANCVIPIPIGIVHGDLNAANILFYRAEAFIRDGANMTLKTGEIPCIIDYAHTGEKALYTDIAKLESVLKFQLLKIDKVEHDDLLQFEQKNILYGLTPSDNPSITDPHLHKLFSCIAVLRKIVKELIQENGYDPLGYWLELYRNTLLHLKYTDISDSQKRYAFFSAALILTGFLVTTAFKISREVKDSQASILFPLKPVATTDRPVPSHLQEEVLEAYKQCIIQRREEERGTEFPKGARFIEPSVRLRVKQSAVEQPPSESRRGDILEEKVEWKSLKLRNLLKEGEKFALIADSGLGKTTLLKELQYQMVTGTLFTESLPIYFHFSDLLRVYSTEALLERIRDLFPAEITREDIQEVVDSLFKQRRLVFLLDGLDQIEDISNLPKLLARDGLLSSHRVIAAGRPYVYSNLQNLLSRYEYLTLSTFSLKQAKEYLGEDSYRSFDSLLQEPSLRAPMLLSILRELGQEAGEGINRSQIYEKMIDKLLSREAAIQAFQAPGIHKEAFKNIFSKLSYLLLDKGYAGRFPWEEVGSLLPELNITWGEFARLTHMGLVSEVMEGSPTPGSDLIFRHQSFQEYLAALELRRRIIPQGKINKEELLSHLEYTRWDEAFLFLIGSLKEQDAKELISWVSRCDLYFAGRCIAYYSGNKDEAFPEIIDRLFERIYIPDAQKALEKIGTEGIITRLLSLSKDKNTRRHVIDALGRIGSERVVEHLIPLLKDEDVGVRWQVVFALGEIGPERVVEHLILLLKDEGWRVRENAASALSAISPERAVDHLIPLLEDKDGDVRWSAASALGEVRPERAVERLIPLLKDEDEGVRKKVASVLGKIGSERVVKHLIPLLEDKDVVVRVGAASALGRIGSEKAVEHIIPLLEDKK